MRKFYKISFITVALLLFSFSTSAKQKLTHPAGKYILISGAKIWYETEGTGEPLLLIPGGPGGSHDYFHPYLSPLAKSFQVVYYDGFGRGKSDRSSTPDKYSFERDVEEIESIRRALGLSQINILGHSYGGFVAQGYAIKYPNSTKRLILSNTLVEPGKDLQFSNNHINDEIKQYLPELWSKVEKLRSQGHIASSPELQEVYFSHIGNMMELFYFYNPSNATKIVFDENSFNPAVYYAIAGKDADFQIGGDIIKLNFCNQLRTLKMPILILRGRSDGIVTPQLSSKFTQCTSQAQTTVFEKSGHYPFIEEQPEFIKVINEFLNHR